MLGWLCIVQSPCAYTPGIRAGAECGATALTPLGATPKARMLWLLAKSFARCKTSRASNAKHPFSKIYRFFDSLSGGTIRRRLYYLSEISGMVMSALQLRAVIFYEIVIENYSSFKRFYAEVFVNCVCAVKLCARHHKRNESQYAVAYLRIVT